MEYAQREIYVPSLVDQGGYVTSLSVMIYRPSDGSFLDWSSGTFKTTGWTTKAQAMAEVDATESLWTYAAGWQTPLAIEEYRVIFKDQDGSAYDGPVIRVRNRIRGKVVTDAGNLVTTFKTDLPTGVDDNHFADSFVTMLTGNMAGQTRRASASVAATQFVTTDAFTQVPLANDEFEIVNS